MDVIVIIAIGGFCFLITVVIVWLAQRTDSKVGSFKNYKE